ncbi:bifunctional precorrin-2 dehydrogenase/sirohydrochlorin ferrochelatase [Lachnospiraceae bacterium YH-ros2226]
MKLFPFFYDITEMRFLVIGGGEVAAGKIIRLTSFTDQITVVAPKALIYISKMAEEGRIRYEKRPFEDQDLDQYDCVISATGNRELNRHVSLLCRKKGIPVNAVDDPENCTFFFPAIMKRGHLTVAISTDGASPSYAAMLKNEVDQNLPDHIEEILDIMSAARKTLPSLYPDLGQKERARVYRKLLADLLSFQEIPKQEEVTDLVRKICQEEIE